MMDTAEPASMAGVVGKRDPGVTARYIGGNAWIGFTILCILIAAGALIAILGYVALQGASSINWAFVTALPRPVGVTGGGVANGIVGSLIIVGIATVMAVPIGVLTGVYLALFGRNAFAEGLRLLADVLAGIPSIAIGLFAYTLFVAPFKHFSAVSASVAFAIIMLPLIIRTTEDAVRTVPRAIREAGFALGLSQFSTTIKIVLPAAQGAILTAILLGVARVTGETAPLLFTAFGSQFWELNPTHPMAELSLQVFTYAISPYDDWHRQAWAGALLLTLAVFALNLLARAALRLGRR
ncbi:MAG: phosphate ABC transporter permease PstA [Candidatus Lustribacter sp.]